MTPLTLRALIVAADAEDAAFVERVLRDHGDETSIASDVADALAQLANQVFDVVFVSLSLPRGDGLALVHHVRALYLATEVVVMSAKDALEETAHAVALGVLHTILYPLTGDAILLGADRARERAMLVADRERLSRDEAQSRRRSATYARCAAFVAETDLEVIAGRVLEACAVELEAVNASVYVPTHAGGNLERVATKGDASSFPEMLPVDELTHLDPTSPVHVDQAHVTVILLGEAEIAALVRLEIAELPSRQAREGLEIIASLGVAALAGSRKVEAIARVGIKDPETSAYTFAYFGDAAGREIARATRFERSFALLTVSLDGMDEVRSTMRRADIASFRRAIADGILESVRAGDVLARVEDDEYFVLLPETGLLGANVVRRRVLESCSRVLEVHGEAASTCEPVLGVASFPVDGEDLGQLVRVVRMRSDQAREGFSRRHPMKQPSFFQLIEDVFRDDPELGAGLALSGRSKLPSEVAARVGAEVAAEVTTRKVKGTVYVGGDDDLARSVLRALPQRAVPDLRIGNLSTLEGPGFSLEVTDPRLAGLSFFIAMTELGGYVMLGRKDGAAVEVFQSAELDLVDAFVTSLQRAYHLQPEIG
jgi:two-component system, cell cycle response regulator